jgi:cobalt-zinc-cadmium resistance protein CzcA
MRLVMQVPGVNRPCRVSAAANRRPIRSRRTSRSHRVAEAARRMAEGWTQDDIQDAMREKLKALPGVRS